MDFVYRHMHRILQVVIGALIGFVGIGIASAAPFTLNSARLSSDPASSLTVEINSPLTGLHFELCVYNPAGGSCAGGLQITMDLIDTQVAFAFTGTTGFTGATGGGGFTLMLSDFDYSPPAIVVAANNEDQGLLTGSFTSSGVAGGVVSFAGEDGGDPVMGITAGAGGLPFELTVEPLDTPTAPAPNALALLVLALAGMGYARRRRPPH